MNLIEKVNENAKRLNVENFLFDNEEESEAFASLSEEQLKMLENDVEYEFGKKYMERCCMVEDILGAAFAWAKHSGELTSDTLFERLHMLLNLRFWWTVVFVEDVERLAKVIVDETKKSIEDAFQDIGKKRCEYTDAEKWWDFINIDSREYVNLLAKKFSNNFGAIELEYRGIQLVVFESPVGESCINGALFI